MNSPAPVAAKASVATATAEPSPIDVLLDGIEVHKPGFKESSEVRDLRNRLASKSETVIAGIHFVLWECRFAENADYIKAVDLLSTIELAVSGRFANVLSGLAHVLKNRGERTNITDFETTARALAGVAQAAQEREVYASIGDLRKFFGPSFCEPKVVERVCQILLEHGPVLGTRTVEMLGRIGDVVGSNLEVGMQVETRTASILSSLEDIEKAIATFKKDSHRVVALIFDRRVKTAEVDDIKAYRQALLGHVSVLRDKGLSVKLVTKCLSLYIGTPGIIADLVTGLGGENSSAFSEAKTLEQLLNLLKDIDRRGLRFPQVSHCISLIENDCRELETTAKIENYFKLVTDVCIAAGRYGELSFEKFIGYCFKIVKFGAEAALPPRFTVEDGSSREANLRYRAGRFNSQRDWRLPITFDGLMKFLAGSIHLGSSEGEGALSVNRALGQLATRKRVDVLGRMAGMVGVISGFVSAAYAYRVGSWSMLTWQTWGLNLGTAGILISAACRQFLKRTRY